MLFRQDVLRRIGAGDVTLAFRRWRRPTVKAGGTLRTPVGVLAIDSVEPIDEKRVTDADARRAGASDREALLAGLPGEGTLHRIEFRLAGPDPRVALRERSDISPAERAEIDARLARLDAASRHGPWTAAVLGADCRSTRHPRTRPGCLARPRDGALQGRRAQAQGARAYREPRGGLPALAARARLLRIERRGVEALAQELEGRLLHALVGDQPLVVAGVGLVLRRAAAGSALPAGVDLELAQRPVDRS